MRTPAATTASVIAPADERPGPFVCPINLTVPRDGVHLPGELQVAYERDAVVAWLVQNPTSPMTRRRYTRWVPLLPVDPAARTVYLRLPRPPAHPTSAGTAILGFSGAALGLCAAGAWVAYARVGELACCLCVGGILAAACLGRTGWRMWDAELRGVLTAALAGRFAPALEGAWPI